MSHMLPYGWEAYKDSDSGQDYYHQASTGKSTWLRPTNLTLQPTSPEPQMECQCSGCGTTCGCTADRIPRLQCRYEIGKRPVYLSTYMVCRSCWCKDCESAKEDCKCLLVRAAEPPPPPLRERAPPPQAPPPPAHCAIASDRDNGAASSSRSGLGSTPVHEFVDAGRQIDQLTETVGRLSKVISDLTAEVISLRCCISSYQVRQEMD